MDKIKSELWEAQNRLYDELLNCERQSNIPIPERLCVFSFPPQQNIHTGIRYAKTLRGVTKEMLSESCTTLAERLSTMIFGFERVGSVLHDPAVVEGLKQVNSKGYTIAARCFYLLDI